MWGVWILAVMLIAGNALAEAPKSAGTSQTSSAVIKSEAKSKTDNRQYPTRDKPLPVTILVTKDDEDSAKKREASTDYYNEQNLQAYKDSASAAKDQAVAGWLVVGLAALETVVAAFALNFLIKTFRETIKAANAAEKSANAAIAAQRAWIGAEVEPSIEMTFEGSGNHVHFGANVTLKNSGNSPAIKTYAVLVIDFSGIDKDNGVGISPTLKKARVHADSFSEHPIGISIFPSESKVFPCSTSIDVAEIKKALVETTKPGKIHMTMAVYAGYKFIGGKGFTEMGFPMSDAVYPGILAIEMGGSLNNRRFILEQLPAFQHAE